MHFPPKYTKECFIIQWEFHRDFVKYFDYKYLYNTTLKLLYTHINIPK